MKYSFCRGIDGRVGWGGCVHNFRVQWCMNVPWDYEWVESEALECTTHTKLFVLLQLARSQQQLCSLYAKIPVPKLEEKKIN